MCEVKAEVCLKMTEFKLAKWPFDEYRKICLSNTSSNSTVLNIGSIFHCGFHLRFVEC